MYGHNGIHHCWVCPCGDNYNEEIKRICSLNNIVIDTG
jgi:hypothetical protein